MEDKVRFIINSNELLEDNTVYTLEKMAEAEGVKQPVVVLPDVHFKLSYHTPTGVVAMVKDNFIPKFVNPNCGMGFIITPFYADDMDDKKIDRIFGYIREHISVSTRMHPVIDEKDMDNILSKGVSWALERFGLDPEDAVNFENKGSMFGDMAGIDIEDITRFIPDNCMKMGPVSMKVLGYGNHFIEMQTIDSLLDKKTAELFGVSEGQICFMFHGDSRAFGRAICDHFSKKAKKLLGLQQLYKNTHYALMSSDSVPVVMKKALEKFNYHANRMKSAVYWKLSGNSKTKKITFPCIEADSDEGRAYMTATFAAQNMGYANRAAMMSVVRDALNEAMSSPGSNIRILCDGNHDALQKEAIGGEMFWAHRNGASRAFGRGHYKDHPVFSLTGQPVLLPSSMGNFSFLLSAGEGCEDSYYSAPHGAGRMIDRGQAREKFREKDVLGDLAEKGMKVYDYGSGKVKEESPEAFKDIDSVVDTVSYSGLAHPVAKLKPLAVLKGWT